jgi:hypothetical protein
MDCWSESPSLGLGRKKILSMGDLLQLPLLVENRWIPVVGRLITRIPCWPHIHKYVLTTPERSTSTEWADFLIQVAKGSLGEFRTCAQLAESSHVTITQSPDAAQYFLCHEMKEPSDCQWIGSGLSHKSSHRLNQSETTSLAGRSW